MFFRIYVFSMICILAVVMILLSSCKDAELQVPIWSGDVPESLCVSGRHQYTHKGVTKSFAVKRVSQDNLYKECGPKVLACTLGGHTIILPDDSCHFLPHELNHIFDQHWVDRPRVGPPPQ